MSVFDVKRFQRDDHRTDQQARHAVHPGDFYCWGLKGAERSYRALVLSVDPDRLTVVLLRSRYAETEVKYISLVDLVKWLDAEKCNITAYRIDD